MPPIFLADQKADHVRCIAAATFEHDVYGDFHRGFDYEAWRLGYRHCSPGDKHCQCGATRHEHPHPHDPACGWVKGMTDADALNDLPF